MSDSDSASAPNPSASPSPFRATRWTLVQRAQGRGEEARAALSDLCEIYYEPVLQFTCRWCGREDRGRDLAHGFFADLLAREQISGADPGKGRFRSYLLAAVKHFLMHERERAAALKRGGQAEHVSWEEVTEPAVLSDEDFDRAWALALIGRALAGLEQQLAAAGKQRQFEVLRPWLDGGHAGDPVEAARQLGLAPTALKVAIHRLRQRFRQAVRDEVASTTRDPAEAADEFRHLVGVWARHAS